MVTFLSSFLFLFFVALPDFALADDTPERLDELSRIRVLTTRRDLLATVASSPKAKIIASSNSEGTSNEFAARDANADEANERYVRTSTRSFEGGIQPIVYYNGADEKKSKLSKGTNSGKGKGCSTKSPSSKGGKGGKGGKASNDITRSGVIGSTTKKKVAQTESDETDSSNGQYMRTSSRVEHVRGRSTAYGYDPRADYLSSRNMSNKGKGGTEKVKATKSSKKSRECIDTPICPRTYPSPEGESICAIGNPGLEVPNNLGVNEDTPCTPGIGIEKDDSNTECCTCCCIRNMNVNELKPEEGNCRPRSECMSGNP